MKHSPLFLPHGAPDLYLTPSPAQSFLRQMGSRLQSAKAFVVISPHWQTRSLCVSAPGPLKTIHDFNGFPQELYKLSYPAIATRSLVDQVLRTLCQAGFAAQTDPNWGLDHGAWIPLLLADPAGDHPIVQISLPKHYDILESIELGRALAPLADEGIQVLGTGSTIHKFQELGPHDEPPPAWAVAFDELVHDVIKRGDINAIANLTSSPLYERALPTDEHFLPLCVALGAAGPRARGRRMHSSYTHRTLSMAAYEFTETPAA